MDQTVQGRKRGSGSAAKLILALIAGVALGAVLSDRSPRAGAQQAPFEGSAGTFRDSLNADAAPRATLGADGRAKFSRPLEVPPLYAFDSPLEDSGSQIILVDSETKRICVYWIRQRGANSTIELVAARNFELDLKLDDFNCEGLSPGQIREQLDSARR
ncbi:MAG: hypothetical protein IIU43_11680 [Thermoguttaceae bacterium]|nr:hypothetical protein [Thermoguttaceae bacterium]